MGNVGDFLLSQKHVALDSDLGAEGNQTSNPNLLRVNPSTSQLEGEGENFIAKMPQTIYQLIGIWYSSWNKCQYCS